MTRVVGSLFGHPASTPGWAGIEGTPHAPGFDELFGSDGACFRTCHGIFTAAHLLVVETSPWCYVDDKEAQVLLLRRDLDIAIVSNPGVDLRELELAAELPRPGQSVTWYGLNDHWQEEQHRVVVTFVHMSRIEVSWAPGKMGPGDSGGPVIDEAGRCIGMMVREARYKVQGRTMWRAVLVPSTVLRAAYPSAEKGRLFE